jgi:flagellar basal-body rod protein FlgB
MQSSPGLLDLLAKRMDWLTQRQSILARNISNADKPGYVPRDLQEPVFARALGTQFPPALAPRSSNPKHIAEGPAAAATFNGEESRERYETAPSGNAVVVEEQMMKVARTQADHQLVTNLYIST